MTLRYFFYIIRMLYKKWGFCVPVHIEMKDSKKVYRIYNIAKIVKGGWINEFNSSKTL